MKINIIGLITALPGILLDSFIALCGGIYDAVKNSPNKID